MELDIHVPPPPAVYPPVVAIAKGTMRTLLRAPLVADTSYELSAPFFVGGAASAGIFVTYKAVDYTTLVVIGQGSYNDGYWFDAGIQNGFSPFTMTLANAYSATTGGFVLDFPCRHALSWIRVAIKRSGGTATGTVAIEAITGTEN